MKRVVVVLLVVVLVASITVPASAGLGEDLKLAQIIEVLGRINLTLARIRETVGSVRDTLTLTYPVRALREIKYAFDQVKTIEDEVGALSCNWRFSVRTQRLWNGLFRGARLCKPEFQLLFGAPPQYALQDLDEYYDYGATRRLNMVSTRVERGPHQQGFFQWLLNESELGRLDSNDDGPYGPGYSQRLSAVGASALGNVLLEQGDTLTAQLELAQERANDRRLRQKLGTELALDIYARLADAPPATNAEAVQ